MAFFECTIGGGDGSILTVTCYSGFAGLTISITNGVDTFSDVCPSTSPYEVEFDGLADGTWTISTVYSGQTYTKTIDIDTTEQFYPIPNGATATPTDDIQTWLHCADIWDKNYTTIAQVLADTSTFQVLIASNNAADYMARSTTWASNVCADSNAMVFIGVNDYCADKLLSNSTWLNAIANSAYFERVLNVKVPTMTSATTPSGIVTASSINSATYAAWKAFDGSNSTMWFMASNDTLANNYLQYDFGRKVKIYKVTAISVNWNTAQIQASNNSEFNAVATLTYSGSNAAAIISNPVAYSKYRFHGTSGASTIDDRSVYTLQLYGRAAS